MSHRRHWFALLLPILLVLLLGAGVVGAQDVPATDSTAAGFSDAEAITPDTVVSNSDVEAATVRLADGRLRVIVELRSEPAAVAFARAGGEGGGAAATAAADMQRSIVAGEQDAFLSAAADAGLGLEVFHRYNTVGNGVSVAVTPEQLTALRALPQVAAIYAVTRVYRDTASSIVQVGAPSAWDGSLGGAYTGDGIVISIIDSGVDYTHRNNGGSGVWPLNPADRTTLADTGGTFPAGNKVIGGYDYVGDAYNGGNPEQSGLPAVDVNSPDPDPIDCSVRPADLNPTFGVTPGQSASGHGSHVAGIAAGFGVNGDGTTYTGPYNGSIPFGTMLIGPGAAPQADILAMRVFGCYGSASSDTIAAAIDDSVNGRFGAVADIVNMSLGSSFGYGGDDNTLYGFYGASMVNATLAGTLIVATTGNQYDTFFVSGVPSGNPAALSVASTADGGEGGVRVNSTVYPARFGIENPPNAVVGPFPFVYLPGNGCAASDYATFPANTFAVVNWTGACGSIGLMTAAMDANTAGGNVPKGLLVPFNAPGLQNLTCGYRGTQTAPTYVPCMSVQQSLGQFLAANPSATITFDPTLTAVAADLSDTISLFSSRGPTRYATNGLKPEITAPGDAITSTGSGLGTVGAVLGGTSMSAPTVAGAAALLMQANPSWSAQQIKALLINTANNDVFSLNSLTGPRVGPQRMGSGRLDIVDALSSDVIAFNNNQPLVASVHFGFPQVVPGQSTTLTRDVRFVNRGAAPATYSLAINTYSNSNIAAFTVSPSSVTIPAFGTSLVTVTLTVSPPVTGTQSANRSDPSMAAVQATTAGNFTRHYLSEETANLVATPTAGATVALRVPLYAAPRAAGSMRAEVNPLPYSGEANTEPGFVNLLPLDGTGVFDAAGGFPQNVIGSVTALQYAGSDVVGDTVAGPGQPYPVPGMDIQYVGIGTNYNTATPSASTEMMIGVSVASDWATLNEMFINIYFDGNQDGFTDGPDDFEVFTTAPNLSGTASRSDVFVSAACYSAGGSCLLHDFINNTTGGFNTYLLSNNVVVIPFLPFMPMNYDGNASTPTTPLMTLGGDTTFNFYVEMFSRSIGEAIDVSPVMTFDLNNPVFDATVQFGSGLWDDQPNLNIPYLFDASGNTVSLTATGSLPAALLLHHHNLPNQLAANGQNFRRAEVVYFDVDQTDLALTKTSSDADGKVLPGETFTYFLRVTNTSSGVVAAVNLTDALPGSLTFVGASPECAHTGQPVGGTVTCTDTLQPLEVANYYIDVRVDPTYVGSIVNTATVTTDILETNGANNTASHTTLVTPPKPTLIAPTGDIIDETPEFSWNDTPGAGWYYMRVMEGTTEVFAGWFEKVVVCSAGVCAVTPSGLMLGPGAYEWMVYGWNEVSGAGPWSDPMAFRVITKPAVPTPIAPIGDITSTDPDFVWSNVLGADDYHLWISRTDGPGTGYVYDLFMSADGLCTGATCTYNTPVTFTAGRYTWWIQASSDVSGLGEWSTGTVFDVNVTPAAPTPIAPTGSITDTTPTFVWSEVPTAQWYYLWLSKGPNKILDQWYDASMICDGTDCEVTPGMVLDAGDYEWFIQAYSPYGGYSAWSSGTDFVIAIAPLAPVQVSPVGAVIQTNPTYTWERSAGATHYAIWVSSSTGYVLDRWYAAADVCTGATCSAMPNVVLSNGVHRWWVQAWNPWGGYSAWTGPMVFNVGGSGGIGETGSAASASEVSPLDPNAIEILPEAPAEGQ